MRLAPLDNSQASLAELVGQLVHDLRSVQTAQAGLLACFQPTLDADPELATHLGASVAQLRTLADDLRIVRLLLNTGVPATPLVSLAQILHRIQQTTDALPLTVCQQVDGTILLPSTMYDLLSLMIRVVSTVSGDPTAPLILQVRPARDALRLHAVVARPVPDAAHLRALLRVGATTPRHTTATMRMQLLNRLAHTCTLPWTARVMHGLLLCQVTLPIQRGA